LLLAIIWLLKEFSYCSPQ